MFNNIDNEIWETEQELKHVGGCTTKGLKFIVLQIEIIKFDYIE